MYYDKQILAIDAHGGFLLAIYFPKHKIGGEITLETGHAYFGYGHIDKPQSLHDITSMCCPERMPSSEEKNFLLMMASGQAELAHKNPGSTMSKHYRENAWRYQYQADLAESNTKHVPRNVLSSLNGKLALGIELHHEHGPGAGLLRFIDIQSGEILNEKTGTGAAAPTLINPHTMAVDGSALLLTAQSTLGFGGSSKFAELQLPKLNSGVSLTQVSPMASFCSAQGMWIAVDDKVHLIEIGTAKLIRSLPLPKGAYNWTAQLSTDKLILAFCGGSGLISVLDLNTTEVRNYFPHRGCKRDDIASVRLSANGEWMLSRILRRKELMITRMQDGVSWQVGELNDQSIVEKEEDEFRSLSEIPAAFAFIGSRILVSDSHEVRELEYREPEDKRGWFVSEQGKPGARAPIKISAKASLEKMLKAAKLENLKDSIERHYSPALNIKTKSSKKSGWSMPDKRGAPALGVSRFGGWPDLPPNTAWPMWQQRPMSFLAQINLREVHATQPDARVPKQGLLLFFLGCNSESYDNPVLNKTTYMIDMLLGMESSDNSGWKVIYAASDADLHRTPYQESPGPDCFSPCMLSFKRGGMALPDEYSAAYEHIAFKPDELDNYNELINLLMTDDMEHQLMGYPSLIQFTPPDMQCELASNGRDPFKFPEQGSDEYKQLVENASDWGLLLQLTSDDNTNYLWGDAGNLYFYGKRSEMENGNFSNTWVCYESH